MELVVAWWNCRLTPPANGAKKYPITADIENTICNLLTEGNADMLGLCEVSDADISLIEKHLNSAGLNKYKVLSLYSKGKSIDDLCLIYDSTRLLPVDTADSANVHDEAYDYWLKAGKFVCMHLSEHGHIYIGLSHWQSRQSMSNPAIRMKLGAALRTKISEIRETTPDLQLILCGDYNDEPFNDSIEQGLGATRDATYPLKRSGALYNPFWPLMGSQDSSNHPPGTYINSGSEPSSMLMFDQIMFSSEIIRSWQILDRMVVNRVPPNQWKAISDHYPILVHLRRI